VGAYVQSRSSEGARELSGARDDRLQGRKRQQRRCGRRLAITALAAIACLSVIHRAILAGLLAGGLICRERSCANQRRQKRRENFGIVLHTVLICHQLKLTPAEDE